MQGFAIFDLIIISITLILGLKGLFRGLIKEVFGIIGIIGAIFVASRISKETGDLLAPILVLENEATIKLIGFVVALVGVWLVVYSAGLVVSKIFSASGLGIIDRILGFVFGAAKIFLIFSVIAYALYQVHSFRKVIDEKFATSIVMPHLISVGSYIIKLDTDSIANSFDKAVKTVKDAPIIKDATSNIKEEVNSTVNDVQEAVKEEVIQQVEEKIEDSTNKTSEQVDAIKEKLKNIANKPEENQ
ncbi:MAG: CvpA family protein [Arcobacter sp.]|jgi:membrane protein required for colicin V production|uniref:CvpA family membrane protein n=1 Tax=Arcobacter defluvii TaxID=873191 RepID=A0AAE7E707_9BACT|nr:MULTISPECIES: CvpA family protein [Arcobacter]MDY3199985.1 CvpA family protein [Arcobacter sp.]QKF76853.1 CvpA family membrane protein [Arcobacter defluvii]RXI33808.1 colicin V synthesis protein [Arcobacter defluvii]